VTSRYDVIGEDVDKHVLGS